MDAARDDATQRYFDEGTVGDWVKVDYLMIDQSVTAEGEFGGFRRSKRGVWFMDLAGVILVPTTEIERIELLVPAGCL